MGKNMFFMGAFNAKVFGKEIIEKKDKIYDKTLQEEHAKLIQLVSKMERKWTIEHLCRKYNLETKYYSPSNE
ncbi:MAG: hypothetical protein AABY49_12135 [Planctomycetota bacterium]